MSDVVTTAVTIPVPRGHVSGTLQVPAGARTVQLLVHGYSYGRYYWDLPYQPETYSYVRRANAAGYATLAFDRLGAGESSKPPGRHLTWGTSARAVAAVVAALRDGDLGPAFDNVILVGHSYGSVTNYLAAGRLVQVEAMIATGAAHRVNLYQITKLALNSPSVARNPDFAVTDPLYVTTRRNWRHFFYNPANTDPEVTEIDEQNKQTAGLFELPTALPYLVNGVSRTTRVPVLTVLGDRDQIFSRRGGADCSSEAALTRFEQRFYAPDATVESVVVPGAGHDLNLERTAPQTYDRMIDFADRYVGHR